MLVQVACGGMNQSMQSVAKRSPRSHPIHVTPQLSTIEEGDVEMAEQRSDAGVRLQPVGGVHTDEEVEVAVDGQKLDSRAPSPEDVQRAKDFQVSFA